MFRQILVLKGGIQTYSLAKIDLVDKLLIINPGTRFGENVFLDYQKFSVFSHHDGRGSFDVSQQSKLLWDCGMKQTVNRSALEHKENKIFLLNSLQAKRALAVSTKLRS